MIARYDIEYSLMREAIERAAWEAATDVAAKSSHLRLANRYADRARDRSDHVSPDNEC